MFRIFLMTLFLVQPAYPLSAIAGSSLDEFNVSSAFGQIKKFDLMLEGPVVKLYMAAFLSKSSLTPEQDAALKKFFDHLVRIRLKGVEGKGGEIQFLMDQAYTLSIVDSKKVKNFSVYGVEFPRFFRLRVAYNNDEQSILFSPVEDPDQWVRVLAKIPLLNDRVDLHSVKFFPGDGHSEFKAGVLGSRLMFYADYNIYDKKFEGISYKKMLLDPNNRELASWILPVIFPGLTPIVLINASVN